MIKGNERRIVVVERLSDPYFERAVFYVRVGVAAGKSSATLADKAQELWDRMNESEASCTPAAAELPPPRETDKHRFGHRKKP